MPPTPVSPISGNGGSRRSRTRLFDFRTIFRTSHEGHLFSIATIVTWSICGPSPVKDFTSSCACLVFLGTDKFQAEAFQEQQITNQARMQAEQDNSRWPPRLARMRNRNPGHSRQISYLHILRVKIHVSPFGSGSSSQRQGLVHFQGSVGDGPHHEYWADDTHAIVCEALD